MLPKELRLTKQDISGYLKSGKRFRTPHFLMIYGKKAGTDHPAASFSASKKIGKTAVVRNRLRRMGYAAIAPLMPQIPENTLLLIAFSSPWLEASLPEMTEELKGAFGKMGM